MRLTDHDSLCLVRRLVLRRLLVCCRQHLGYAKPLRARRLLSCGLHRPASVCRCLLNDTNSLTCALCLSLSSCPVLCLQRVDTAPARLSPTRAARASVPRVRSVGLPSLCFCVNSVEAAHANSHSLSSVLLGRYGSAAAQTSSACNGAVGHQNSALNVASSCFLTFCSVLFGSARPVTNASPAARARPPPPGESVRADLPPCLVP